MKTIFQIVLWIACIGLGFLIYKSVTGPIEFKKVKQARFAEVITTLKDIRDSQEAYKTVNGKFAADFKSLIAFVDTGQYTITQRRDSSYMEFDKTYGIDLLKEVTIVDTLGFVKVKDSLFKGDERYKGMMNVPNAQNNEQFTMKADILDKAGYKASVFEAKVNKDVVLFDQPKDLVDRENAQISVEEVNGSEIIVGSLSDVSTNGNWPPIYDKKQ
ncbi:MAG: hypothetical protein ACR2MM_11805 [Flavobacteriaceae bacterium]